MFYLSKAGWFIGTPSNLLVVLVVLGAILALRRRRRARFGAWLSGTAGVLLLLVGLLPASAWLLLPLEDRFPAYHDDPTRPVAGAIVLGGAIWPEVSFARGQLALNEAAERMIAMADLARRHPDMRIVFTGGSGNALFTEQPEADAVERFGAVLGIAPGRIIYENRSRTTFENARETLALASPKPGERWLLVTSAWHMPRSVGVFRKAGFDVEPYPVDYLTASPQDLWRPLPSTGIGLARFDLAAKEWVGLLAYRVTGRSDEVFPGP